MCKVEGSHRDHSYIYIYMSVYFVLNSLWDWEPVERLKHSTPSSFCLFGFVLFCFVFFKGGLHTTNKGLFSMMFLRYFLKSLTVLSHECMRARVCVCMCVCVGACVGACVSVTY